MLRGGFGLGLQLAHTPRRVLHALRLLGAPRARTELGSVVGSISLAHRIVFVFQCCELAGHLASERFVHLVVVVVVVCVCVGGMTASTC